MRILAGAAVRQNSAVLEAHLRTMKSQVINDDVELDFMYVNDLDPNDPDYAAARDVLFDDPDVGVYNTDIFQRPDGADYGVTDATHTWKQPTFEYLGGLKDLLLKRAVADDYDAVWLVDTDLLVGPETLQSLINAQRPVVSAVFWTSWSPGSPLLPQVWQRHPYELDGGRTKHAHVFLGKLSQRSLLTVGGLGACTLISIEAVKAGLTYTPLIEGLPTDGMWQGEDRHFCVRAARLHIELWADAWPDVYHLYRPADRQHIKDIEQDLLARGKPTAELGDLVSFTVEPLTIPALANFKLPIRGRLGQLRLLPELEVDLQNMEVGEAILTELHYPVWFPVPEFAGTTSTVRLQLLDAKYYLPHVGLPQVYSEFQDNYYTPSQLAAMKRSTIHENDPDD